VPQNLFEKSEISKHLKSLKDEDDNFYRAILQNLFFATLNQKMDKKLRQFAEDQDPSGRVKEEGGIKNLYRYREEFNDPHSALGLFANVPFLNGGLFACLDQEVKKGKVLYADGFTRDKRKMAHVPNFLFFSEKRTVDLSVDYGQSQKRNAHVTGLLNILKRYKFTIAENTPVEQEIALDPELLGKVFENLLASYNPETCTTARTATGSFYTPRSIVDYMVDESLKSYFFNTLHAAFPGTSEQFIKTELAELLSYSDRATNFSADQIYVLVKSIDTCNILDPACGSGAFPMGILHKLVHVLKKLDDSENSVWKRIQLEKVGDNDKQAKAVESNFSLKNEPDYARKLYLIASSIYGVDIQPIAIQISKLRFFISLICDQKVTGNKAENRGIQPLPNLETRFVAANALIELSKNNQLTVFHNPRIQYLGRQLEQTRHEYFSAQDRKSTLERDDEKIRNEIIAELDQKSISEDAGLKANWKKIAQWNPYDHFDAAEFFEPAWMFGKAVSEGFDIIIGNPPYIKEDINKAAFSGVKESECYQGKMDLWYLFGARGLDILKPDGTLAYIATNNWITNDGASKFRNKLLKEARLSSFIDFGNYKIFAAGVQTMILIAQKSSENERYSVEYGRIHNDRISKAQLAEFLISPAVSIPDYEKYCISDFVRDDYVDGYISFVPPRVQSVLTKMRSSKVTYLKERTEIFSGIDILQDFVSKKHVARLKTQHSVGDGIFVLNNQEKNSIEWNFAELSKLKPYYRPKEIHRYFANESNQLWVIYTGAQDNKTIANYPNIKNHLDKFQPVLTSVNKPYGLHRAREEANFLGAKILCVRKCQRPSFSLVEFASYVGRTFMLIKTTKLDLWVLLSILNSKLVTFWLIFKGKRQGNQFQIDGVPLQNIPLAIPPDEIALELKALAQSRMNEVDPNLGKSIEQRIDALVYAVYGLNTTDIATVESTVAALVQEDSEPDDTVDEEDD
jgi:type I restriction-modification system DNA methylase subunit